MLLLFLPGAFWRDGGRERERGYFILPKTEIYFDSVE